MRVPKETDIDHPAPTKEPFLADNGTEGFAYSLAKPGIILIKVSTKHNDREPPIIESGDWRNSHGTTTESAQQNAP